MAIERPENVMPANPFAGQGMDERFNVGAVSIESERAIAEVKAAVVMSRHFPRNKAAAFERIIDTCKRKDFAHSATYTYPRGGESVSGPSIRLAEELARGWGNLLFGWKELSVYKNDKGEVDEIEVLAYCWDLETNVRSEQAFRVKAERHTRQGVTKLNDPRDIYENTANSAARRLRSRILAVIPTDLVSAAVQQCRETIAGGGDLPLSQKVGNIVKQFAKLGIQVKHIEARLGHQIDECLPDEYADLVGIYTSLKDGVAQASDYFNVPKAAGVSEAATEVQERLTGGRKATSAQVISITAKAKDLGLDSDRVLGLIKDTIGREVTEYNELTGDEAKRVLTALDAKTEAA